eukprot:TRINITY_DN6777_c0_g1_i3.p1 TRINITY_DN6777_c0_g1~~TRINITY_DN6777_c0_g1_i3.p1  ORF type:complete len:320 (-),score=64.31 TRINITY_DN6777_c0_g1_i3:171-1130(-)
MLPFFSNFEKTPSYDLGVVYTLVSESSVAFMSLFIKILSQNHFIFKLFYFRSLCLFLFNFIITRPLKNIEFPTDKRAHLLLISRAVCGFGSTAIWFYGQTLAPISLAAALSSTSPLFSLILGPFFGASTFKLRSLLIILFSFFGVCLIMKPPFLFQNTTNTLIQPLGVFINLSCGFLISMIQYQLKDLNKLVNSSSIVHYYGLIASALCACAMFWKEDSATSFIGMEWVYVLFMGLFGSFSNIFMTRAYKYGDPVTLGIVGYCQNIIVCALDYFILGVRLDYYSIVGIGCIVAGCIMVILEKKKHQENQDNLMVQRYKR